MKRISYIVFTVLPLLATSCLIQEKDLFDETAAERMDSFLTEYKEILESDESGWLFEYYPEANQSFGGYAYILSFKEGEVTAYFQLADAEKEPVTSAYRLTTDDGPILSFDSYNENLHFFANPSASDYQGYQGDYEYNILGKSDDGTEIYIKGRRSGNRLTLKKFEGSSPADYLAKISEISQAMKAPAYTLTAGDVTSDCSISGNIFEYTDGGTAGQCAYCYTDTGIRFYTPVEIGGQIYTELSYSNESLVSSDGQITIALVFPPVNRQFVDGDWMLDLESCSEQAKALFNEGFNAIGAAGYPFYLAFMGDAYYGSYGFNVNFGGYAGVYNFNYELAGEDKIILQFAGSVDGNGGTFMSWGLTPALVPLGYDTPKTFTMTADNIKTPSVITLTEDADENNVIVFAL